MIKTVLFGAGTQATLLYHNEHTERELIAVLDNNPKAQGGYFFSLPILAPDQIHSLEYDEIIITTQKVAEARRQLVDELKITPEKIITPQRHLSRQLHPFRHQHTAELAGRLLNHISTAAKLSHLDLMTDFTTLLQLQQGNGLGTSESGLAFSLPYTQMSELVRELPCVLNEVDPELNYSLDSLNQSGQAVVALVVEVKPAFVDGRSFNLVFRARYEHDGMLIDLPSRGLFYSPAQFCQSLKLKSFGNISAKVPENTADYLNFIYDDWQASSRRPQVQYKHRGLTQRFENNVDFPDVLTSLFRQPEDVSIVTAVFNHEETLTESLDSALLQISPYSIHIYCFDDASTDSSSIILQQYQAKFSDRITVFTSLQNQGSGKKSFLFHRPDIRGRYWGFLAGDDFWLDVQKIYKQTSYLDSKPEAVGCCCDTVLYDERTESESLIASSLERWNRFDLFLYSGVLKMYTHTSSILWRNIWRERRGFFLPAAFEKSYASGDSMLSHMMLAYGGEMHRLKRTMSCYRYTGKGVWSSLTLEQQRLAHQKAMRGINRASPLLLRLLQILQPLRQKIHLLKKVLPGPLNER